MHNSMTPPRARKTWDVVPDAIDGGVKKSFLAKFSADDEFIALIEKQELTVKPVSILTDSKKDNTPALSMPKITLPGCVSRPTISSAMKSVSMKENRPLKTNPSRTPRHNGTCTGNKLTTSKQSQLSFSKQGDADMVLKALQEHISDVGEANEATDKPQHLQQNKWLTSLRNERNAAAAAAIKAIKQMVRTDEMLKVLNKYQHVKELADSGKVVESLQGALWVMEKCVSLSSEEAATKAAEPETVQKANSSEQQSQREAVTPPKKTKRNRSQLSPTGNTPVNRTKKHLPGPPSPWQTLDNPCYHPNGADADNRPSTPAEARRGYTPPRRVNRPATMPEKPKSAPTSCLADCAPSLLWDIQMWLCLLLESKDLCKSIWSKKDANQEPLIKVLQQLHHWMETHQHGKPGCQIPVVSCVATAVHEALRCQSHPAALPPAKPDGH